MLPCIVIQQVFKGLSRRFGHAGTDRQAAYLSPAEIEAAASRNDLFGRLKLYYICTDILYVYINGTLYACITVYICIQTYLYVTV